jgi:hypothetical protein
MPAYMIDIEHQDRDQVFSYYHGEHGGEMMHFNVSLLGRLRKQMPNEFRRITMDLDEAIYNVCMDHRGIEEPRVVALTPTQLREPGYGVVFDGPSFTIVDGHHRLVRRWRGGVRVMDFWVTDKAVWQHCLVEYSKEHETTIAAAMPPKAENPELIASRVQLHPHKDDKP